MKLTLSGKNVRFRISKHEFEVLQEQGKINGQTNFASEQKMAYKVIVDELSFSVKLEENCITLYVTPEILRELDQNMPSKEGISKTFSFDSGNELECSLQVDILDR